MRPFKDAERVRRRLDATEQQMAAYMGITTRTYQRRADSGLLNGAETAKVQMIEALLAVAERVLGGAEEGREWLQSPILSLGGSRPIDLLDSITGYERARTKLMQIEYGTY